ncbi:MAG: hypothetical protein JWR26_5005 [Pedosphaera sp.]|nr:hypothetical protein [Pedosphaera sp.]
MKSSTLIASYLWKDTWKRWCEQPGSPMARLFVTILLVAVATVILVSFQLLERSLQERLERFGLDTLLIRQTVTPNTAGFSPQGGSPDQLALLSSHGRRLRLRQLFARAQTEWQENNLLVFSYPPEAMATLVGMLSPETSVVCLSDVLPNNALVRVQVGRRSLIASVARPQNWLRGLSSDDILLVPQGWLADEEQLGWIDTTVFQRAPSAPSMYQIIAAVNGLASLDQNSPPQIQSAQALVHELDQLKSRQVQWEGLLAAILGGAVALVYGAIAVLEFRQNLFVGALLRSFGVPPSLLFFKHWLEDTLLVNLAALAAVITIALLHSTIFDTLGLSGETLVASGPNPYTGNVIVSIFLWINAGAFLSSLPVASGLRQPIGEILN